MFRHRSDRTRGFNRSSYIADLHRYAQTAEGEEHCRLIFERAISSGQQPELQETDDGRDFEAIPRCEAKRLDLPREGIVFGFEDDPMLNSWVSHRIDSERPPLLPHREFEVVNKSLFCDGQEIISGYAYTIEPLWQRQGLLGTRMDQDLSDVLNTHFKDTPEEEIPHEIRVETVKKLLPEHPDSQFVNQIRQRRAKDEAWLESAGDPNISSRSTYENNYIANERQRREGIAETLLSKRPPETLPKTDAERKRKQREKKKKMEGEKKLIT
jgi:hypothetical protein